MMMIIHDKKFEIASDCSNLDDGLQYILPDINIGTVIPVTCWNGWTILDGSLTPNIYYYFTSYSIPHRDDTVIYGENDIFWQVNIYILNYDNQIL